MSEFAFERGRRMVSSSPEDLAPSPEPRFLASSPVSEDDVATRVFGVALQQEGGGHRRSASSCVVGQRKQKIIGVEERNPKKKRRRTVSNRPIEKERKDSTTKQKGFFFWIKGPLASFLFLFPSTNNCLSQRKQTIFFFHLHLQSLS